MTPSGPRTVKNHCNYTETTETVPVWLTQALKTVNNHCNYAEAIETVPVWLIQALETVNNHCNYTEDTEKSLYDSLRP